MPKHGYRLLLFLLLLCYGNANGQIFQVPERSILYQTAGQWLKADTTYQVADTSLERFYLYEPKHRKDFGGTDLGNIGSAYQPYLVDTRSETGFKGYRNYWDLYQLKEDSIRYISSRAPYTLARYSQGPKQYVQLELTHAQQVNKQLCFGANYYRLTSTGYFQRQNTSIYGIQAWVLFQTKNQRYRSSLSWTFNKFTNQENGGVVSDSAFVFNPISNGENVPIVFAQAENRMRQQQYTWRNYYFIGGNYRKTSDTTEALLYNYVLSHTLKYKVENWRYENINHDSALYSMYLRYPDNTRDTMHFSWMENKFMLATAPWDKNGNARSWFLNAGINLELYQFYQPGQLKYGLNTWLEANGGIRKNGAQLELNMSQALPGGYNAGDFRYRFLAAQRLGEFFVLRLESQFQRFHPEWTTQRYIGNHYFFTKELNPSLSLFNEVGLDLNKGRTPYKLRFRYQTLSDPIIYNAQGLPEQWSGSSRILQASFEKILHLWIFHLDNRVLWQQVQGLQAFRVPELSAIESFYIQFEPTFKFNKKKVLKIQVGVSAFFRSSYVPYAWNPDLRAFYLVNTTAIPAYPQADVWLNVQAKRVLAFIRFEHANMGFSDPRYYSSYLYPMSQRTLRFGLHWSFYN